MTKKYKYRLKTNDIIIYYDDLVVRKTLCRLIEEIVEITGNII